MKTIPTKLILLLFAALALPQFGAAQDRLSFDLEYEVNRIYPFISISKTTLLEAKTLTDLNSRYESSWIKEYRSVEIMTIKNGSIKKSVSKNDVLTPEQKDLMAMADVGTRIAVNVEYLPDNNLKDNEVKEINFTFSVDPDREATYIGGQQQLSQFLKEHAMDKIAASSFKQHQLTALKFTIDEVGQVVGAHVFESSRDPEIDELLLETICNMPSWQPAEYADGTRVKQEFAFTAGDHKSCVLNLLTIRRD